MTIPGWVEALLRWVALPGHADDAIGDLNEMLARHVARRGPLLGRALAVVGALDMGMALYRQRLRGRGLEIYRIGSDGGLGGPHYDRREWDMGRFIDGWIRDLVQAARSLGRARAFSVVTVVTLALAIGANTAIFSVVDAVLLDPLDFPAADRLVSIRASAPGTDMPDEFGPGPEFYVQYSEEADMLEELGMYATGQTTVRGDDQFDRLFVTQATPTLFTTLGATPALGRLPTAEDDAGQVILVSHQLWTTWFGSDPAVVGRSYEVSGAMRTVIGVMPPEWRFPEARVSDVALTDLEAQLGVLAARLPERFGGPASYARIIEQHRPVVRTLEEAMVGDVAGPLWLLLGTVGIVLLIACANVANLFTVRAEGRRRDLAIRTALGAGRGGLVRTQMAEALLLAGLGGAGGVLLAWVGLPLLVRVAPENIPNLDATGLDGMALAFTAGVSILTACVFGLAPALRFSRPRFVGGMRQAGAVGEGGPRYGRDALVLVQTALALVLLVGSGLLMRSFWTLSHVDPGYDTASIFTFQVAPARDGLTDGPTYARFHQGFMDQVAALPGVTSVGLTNWLPLDEGAATNRFATEDHVLSGEQPPPMRFTIAGGDYFETMGISLRRGRLFEPQDHEVGPTNILVSEAAARLLWPERDPLGQRLLRTAADTTNWFTVVGVVENILVDDFRQDVPTPMVYLPMVGPTARSWAVGSPAYVVRTPRADVIAPEIRELMRVHVPESPMYRVFTMEGLADRSMAQLSFTMLMLAVASGLALILGAVGLYGVLSYVVTNRAREIAVRMALGAQAERVLRLVVAQGARITAVGVVVGLVVAFFMTRLLESLLFGVEALDVPTFVAMAAVMVAVALMASYIPARRAASVDPMHALRAE